MKKIYLAPELEIVILDNEISLVLSTGNAPPPGPNEGVQGIEENNQSPWE